MAASPSSIRWGGALLSTRDPTYSRASAREARKRLGEMEPFWFMLRRVFVILDCLGIDAPAIADRLVLTGKGTWSHVERGIRCAEGAR